MDEHFIPIGELMMSIAVYIEVLLALTIAFLFVCLLVYIFLRIIESIVRTGLSRYHRILSPVEPEHAYSPMVSLQHPDPV